VTQDDLKPCYNEQMPAYDSGEGFVKPEEKSPAKKFTRFDYHTFPAKMMEARFFGELAYVTKDYDYCLARLHLRPARCRGGKTGWEQHRLCGAAWLESLTTKAHLITDVRKRKNLTHLQ
jgi:hypothetical protein